MKKIIYTSIFALSICSISSQGGAVSTQQGLVIGPYIPSADQHSAMVAFELAKPSPATVTVKMDGGSRAYQSDRPQTLHFVAVDGLRPGMAYQYGISLPSGDLGERGRGLIKTAALSGESFSFSVIGDPRPGENRVNVHHAALAEQIALLDPAFSLILGDLVDDGSNAAHWQAFFDVEKAVGKKTVLFPVLGDNDHAGGKGLMPRYFPGLAKGGYYSFTWGGVYFFGLSTWDTKGRQPTSEFDGSSEQYRWLAGELRKQEVQEAPFRIVFLHDPVFISRGRASGLLQETLAPLFERSRVDLVFSSWHLYERSQVKRVNYIISGGGGAELLWSTPDPNFKAIADAKRYHFCRVDVGAGGLTLRAVAEDGTVLDQISLATNVGDDTPNKELARYASRMAKINTYGDTRDKTAPVYVFDAKENPFELSTTLLKNLSSLGSKVVIYSFNLRKKGVFNLLLHARGIAGAENDRLPAIFVGGNHLAKPEDLSLALSRGAADQKSDLFQQQSNLSEIRTTTFGALSAGTVALNGFQRILTVGGLFWLAGLGLLLFSIAKRRGPVMRAGWVAIGGGFLLCMLSGIFYYDIIKKIPSPDLIATLLGPRERSLVFFEIQAMMNQPAFRGAGLWLLALRSGAALLPSVAVMGLVKTFALRSHSTKDVANNVL